MEGEFWFNGHMVIITLKLLVVHFGEHMEQREVSTYVLDSMTRVVYVFLAVQVRHWLMRVST